MNLPTILTLLRLPALFLISGLVYAALWKPASGLWGTAALMVFIAAAFTDWLDGRLARLWNQSTVLGNFLDTLSDKIFTIGLFSLLLVTGGLPPWSLFGVLIILCREFLIVGLRLLAAYHGTSLEAERDGKIKAALQMAAIGLLLLALAFEWDRTGVQDYPVLIAIVRYGGYGVFVAAVALTLISGIRYTVKYRSLFSEQSLNSQE